MARTKAFDREEVLTKAVGLFWQKGFHATSIQDLVNHLGINRASMYDTFESKEALFIEALQLYKTQASQHLPSTPSTGAEAKRYIREMLQKTVHDSTCPSEARGCFMVNTTAESGSQPEAVQQLLCKNKEQFVQNLSQLISMARQDGLITNELPDDVLARHLFAFFNGLQVLSQIEQDPYNLQSMVDTQLATLFG